MPFQPFEERIKEGLSADKIIEDLFVRLAGGGGEAFIIAILPPPPVRGIGNSGGFKMQVQERLGPDVRRILGAIFQLMGKARQDPKPAGVVTTFSANSPQISFNIDRQKAENAQRADQAASSTRCSSIRARPM